MPWIPNFLKSTDGAPSNSTLITENATEFTQERPALLVTNELDKALENCKAKVDRISKDCRARNRKFRDIEFDLENDQERCLHGLSYGDERYDPSDVQRVTQIYENPHFFVDGANSNDIVQGAMGDCWFLSALATMSTAPGLVEKFCVARDEKVGVYGFIFFRDTAWVTIIIDDMLFTSIPKFEELSAAEKQLYHDDKDIYNKSARKGGKTLYFARSGTPGETWVPLIEKAYAKLHGDYHALSGGQSCEAIEDLTGGVSTFIPSKDILDIESFWKDELLKANTDRLFGCSFDNLDTTRSGSYVPPTVNGLIGGHAYSVLRAVECNGKRFVVVRNPWGRSEWTGPWSDGSKEWTKEWLGVLEELGHGFGNDGEFVMEYSDFLNSWEQIDRTRLFDPTWVMSSQWLHVPARPLPAAWSFGDVSFTISLPAPSLAVIVLSQLDDRYFHGLEGNSTWTFDFILYKKDQTEPVGESSHAMFFTRSVNLEMQLDAGDYVLHVRLDRSTPTQTTVDYSSWDQRKYARVLTERANSQSIASNFKTKEYAINMPTKLEIIAGQDLSTLEAKDAEVSKATMKENALKLKAKEKARLKKEKAKEKAKAKKEKAKAKENEKKKKAKLAAKEKAKDAKKEEAGSTKITIKETTEIEATQTTLLTEGAATSEVAVATAAGTAEGDVAQTAEKTTEPIVEDAKIVGPAAGEDDDEDEESELDTESESEDDDEDDESSESDSDDDEEAPASATENSLYLGLRVYTSKESPAQVGGQLRKVKSSAGMGMGMF